MSTFAGYESCSRCVEGAQPGTAALADYLTDQYPQSANWGIYSCRSSTGGGGLSIHACGRALDLGVPTVDYGLPILARLVADPKRYGLQGVIFNRKRYDAQTPSGRTYTGSSPHTDHLHIEQTSQAALNLKYDDYQQEEPPPMATYRTVKNVPEESNGTPKDWAKDVIDDGIAVGAINVTDTNPDDWEKPLTYGVLWTILDRLKWPKGSQQ